MLTASSRIWTLVIDNHYTTSGSTYDLKAAQMNLQRSLIVEPTL